MMRAEEERMASAAKQGQAMLKEEVDEEDIAEVVSKWTHIPVSRLMEGEIQKLIHMEERLHQRVVGQDEAIRAVANAIRRARAGLQDPNRPLGSFIFLGPTGVGKTELARALAEFLFDDEHAMIRIDMSEYQEKHTVSRLLGAPPGYVGYEEAGQLTEAVRRRPYSVVLFDEIEKAHPEVLNVLLQLLDDGRLTDGKGRTIDFKNTVVIMTSNLGSAFLADLGEGGIDEGVRRQVMDALRAHFRPEFINRVDEIIIFHPLSREQMKTIIDIQVKGLLKRLEERKIFVALTDTAKEWLVREGYDPAYGARPLKRAIQRHILDPLAMRVLEGEFREGDRVQVDAGPAGLQFAKQQAGAVVARIGDQLPPASRTPNPRGERRTVPRRPSGHHVVRPRLSLPAGAGADLLPGARRPPDSLQRVQVARRAGQGCRSHRRRADHPRHAETRRRERESRSRSSRRASRIRRSSPSSKRAASSTRGELMNRWLPELLSWIIPLLLLVALWSFFFRKMGGAEGGVMAFARSKAKIYAEDDVKVRFGDVAGVDEAKEELMEIVEFLQHPKKYTNIGGRIPKGVLLVGPPGTGKTLLAKAVAGEAKVPFFSLSGSEFVEMFVGVGAARVRDLFGQAEAKAPCIVFIDELDALGKVRVQGPMGGHEEREQTLNQLLAEMDGFDSRKGVIIMGATNRPEVLDPALLRPGRFDRQVLVDKPDVRGREEILRIHARQVKMTPNVDLRVVAQRTAGFAGADLANLVNEAALLAARQNKEAVEMSDFNDAIDRLIAGLEKKRVMSVRERETVAYHESGHAIVASVLPGLDPVHKISIVQRGFGALGYTMQLPLEDRYLLTRRDLENQMAVLLGGRSAEEIALGEISTGAQNDLQRATDIARAMVTQFGMSEELGTVNYEGSRRNAFLDIPMGPERGPYGEDTAQRIDSEVKRLLEDAHDRARQVINERRQLLEMITRRLLEKEVIEGDELQELIAQADCAISSYHGSR